MISVTSWMKKQKKTHAITRYAADIKYGPVLTPQAHWYSAAKKAQKIGATKAKNN